MNRITLVLLALTLTISACNNKDTDTTAKIENNQKENNVNYHGQKYNLGNDKNLKDLKYPGEKHFKNVKQLTFKGDNAEGYWSFDGKKLVFQAHNENWGDHCDQIYIMDALKGLSSPEDKAKLVSTGKGRTTCSYFLPGDSLILYASTHEGGENCPPEPSKTAGYVWGIYPSYDIYVADLNGNIKKKLTNTPGYDAEATVSPKGDKIVYTSTRSGDIELWTMDIDGSNKKQVTHELGYDGGAFFSPDGTKLIFRSSRPKTPEEIKKYKDLLAKNLVEPTDMELFICDIDGNNMRQITHLGNANWSPYFLPSGKKVLFSSNHKSKKGFPFNLFMINIDGTGLEQITFGHVFESFPVFSPDGKYLVFASNRNNGGTRDTNLFLAEWVD
jgi:Tol biopolymer transport system component